ncbi:hypothetical protein RB200_16515 [Streptomyces sp. PmtG]
MPHAFPAVRRQPLVQALAPARDELAPVLPPLRPLPVAAAHEPPERVDAFDLPALVAEATEQLLVDVRVGGPPPGLGARARGRHRPVEDFARLRHEEQGEVLGGPELLLGVGPALREVRREVRDRHPDPLRREPPLAQALRQARQIPLGVAVHRTPAFPRTSRTDVSKASQRPPCSASTARPASVSV